eukprot:2940573-Amphidinium_carterae.1
MQMTVTLCAWATGNQSLTKIEIIFKGTLSAVYLLDHNFQIASAPSVGPTEATLTQLVQQAVDESDGHNCAPLSPQHVMFSLPKARSTATVQVWLRRIAVVFN